MFTEIKSETYWQPETWLQKKDNYFAVFLYLFKEKLQVWYNFTQEHI